jgi:hypothetical protein
MLILFILFRCGDIFPGVGLVLDFPDAAAVCPGLCSSHQPEILARLQGQKALHSIYSESAISHIIFVLCLIILTLLSGRSKVRFCYKTISKMFLSFKIYFCVFLY